MRLRQTDAVNNVRYTATSQKTIQPHNKLTIMTKKKGEITMSGNIWERFDNIASADEVVEARSKFEPIPAGEYMARLEKLEPSESKNGLPMLKGQFRTEENRIIFYNQMLQNISTPHMTAVNIAEAVRFLSAITDTNIEYEGLAKLAQVVEGIELGGMFEIEVSYGKNDDEMKFPKIKVLESIPF